MLSQLSDWFWNERLWFPVGLGWADLQDRDGKTYAKGSDLWVTLPIALVFLIIRQIFERTVALRLASAMGVEEKVRVRAAPNPTLETYFYATSKHPAQ
ncbi:ceramide synthase 2a, partial [Tachysurus ichikawai]